MMKKLNGIYFLFILCLMAAPVFTQDDHGHTHEETGAPDVPAQLDAFILYAESQKYELTLKHGELQPGNESELTLYIADYITNQPLEGVDVKVGVQEDASLTFTSEVHEPGVYHIHGTFPERRSYALAVNLNSSVRGADLLLLQPVEVGKKNASK